MRNGLRAILRPAFPNLPTQWRDAISRSSKPSEPRRRVAEARVLPTPWSRRAFLRAGRSALALALLAPFAVAHAQPPEKTYRIGFLYTGTRIQRDTSPSVKGFRQGLKELGWIEGKNLVI